MGLGILSASSSRASPGVLWTEQGPGDPELREGAGQGEQPAIRIGGGVGWGEVERGRAEIGRIWSATD